MDKKLIDIVKAKMEYEDGTECCRACISFVPTDCSGDVNAKSQHCERNTFDIPVSEAGKCRFFISKHIKV